MYRTVEGGYKLIGEKALLQPLYGSSASLGSETLTSQPLYMNTLPRSIDTGIPMTESTLCLGRVLHCLGLFLLLEYRIF